MRALAYSKMNARHAELGGTVLAGSPANCGKGFVTLVGLAGGDQ
jgi:hypothetical protein